MHATNYMADPARVEDAVQRVYGMTVGEICRYQPKSRTLIEFLREDVMETFSFDEETVNEMELMDLICILYQRVDYLQDDKDYEMRMVEIDILRECFLGIEQACIPMKLFLGIPVRAFYEYLESLYYDGTVLEEWNGFERRLSAMLRKRDYLKGDVGDMTLKEIFIFIGKERRRSWCPLNSLRDYQIEILAAHKITELIIARSFEVAMPERFDIKNVLTKYERR